MFENEADIKVHTAYYLPKVEINDCNFMIDRKNFFDQPVKRHMRTYDNICKVLAAQADGYTTGCVLDYNYFKQYYKMIATEFSKQQALDSDSKN